jgi:hypothetical protein
MLQNEKAATISAGFKSFVCVRAMRKKVTEWTDRNLQVNAGNERLLEVRVAQKPHFNLDCKFMILSERKRRVSPCPESHVYGPVLDSFAINSFRIVASSLL